MAGCTWFGAEETETPGLLIDCDRCGDKLVEQGAVIFGPPGLWGPARSSEKLHICKPKCWPEIRSFILHFPAGAAHAETH